MIEAIVFDCETTCIDNPEVIELAAVEVSLASQECQPLLVDSRYSSIKPISFGAMATHHIVQSDIDGLSVFSPQCLPQSEFVIGHNVDFDWECVGKPDVKRICTLALARMVWPDADSHTLNALNYMLRGESFRQFAKNAHSALADVHATVYLLREIVGVLGVTSFRDLYVASEKARIPVKMTFGKHKGMLIKDVPSDYKSWLLRQPDVDKYLEIALTI